VVSTGSFNSWFDVETLFHGLEHAMERNGRITFVSSGGSVPFAEEQYRRFSDLVSGSRFRSRFTLAGWVDREELERIQDGAGAAVYADIPCGESLLGARTRVLDWISRGIPVVCTMGAEISETVGGRGMGLTVPQGDHAALGEALVRLASAPGEAEAVRRAQEEWRRGDGRIDSVFRPLLEWCRDPVRLTPGQLCPPTVARLSSRAYRMAVLREIVRRKGAGSAAGFLAASMAGKLRKRSR
jgi:glycosyltransferase involved in cell wall biosynthesis